MSEDNGTGAAKPTNVTEALAAVMVELPGIGKDQHSEAGYNYRGIEAITRHVQGLFGKYGVVAVPKVLSRKTIEFSINSRPWTEEQLEVMYRFYGPSHGKVRRLRRPIRVPGVLAMEVDEIDEVIEDWIDVGPIIGLGRDNSDKGTNKAMTQALKYALIQTLCIGDQKDDPDRETAHERDPEVDLGKQARAVVRLRIQKLDLPVRQELAKFCDDEEWPRVPAEWTDEQLQTITSWLDDHETNAANQGSTAPPAAPEETPAPQPGSQSPTGPSEATNGDGSPDPVGAIIALVKQMDIEGVDAQLRQNGMTARGTHDARRARLAEYLVEQHNERVMAEKVAPDA